MYSILYLTWFCDLNRLTVVDLPQYFFSLLKIVLCICEKMSSNPKLMATENRFSYLQFMKPSFITS